MQIPQGSERVCTMALEEHQLGDESCFIKIRPRIYSIQCTCMLVELEDSLDLGGLKRSMQNFMSSSTSQCPGAAMISCN